MLQAAHDPDQSGDVDTRPDDDTPAIHGYDLDAVILRHAPIARGLALRRHERRDKARRGDLFPEPALPPGFAPVQQKLP